MSFLSGNIMKLAEWTYPQERTRHHSVSEGELTYIRGHHKKHHESEKICMWLSRTGRVWTCGNGVKEVQLEDEHGKC